MDMDKYKELLVLKAKVSKIENELVPLVLVVLSEWCYMRKIHDISRDYDIECEFLDGWVVVSGEDSFGGSHSTESTNIPIEYVLSKEFRVEYEKRLEETKRREAELREAKKQQEKEESIARRHARRHARRQALYEKLKKEFGDEK